MPAWTVLDEEVQQGMIHRVNREDEHGHVTYETSIWKNGETENKTETGGSLILEHLSEQRFEH